MQTISLQNIYAITDIDTLQFPLEPQPWPSTGIRRASVNSFGFGGTNGHAVPEDAYNHLRLRSLSGRHCTNPQPLRSKLSHRPWELPISGITWTLRCSMELQLRMDAVSATTGADGYHTETPNRTCRDYLSGPQRIRTLWID